MIRVLITAPFPTKLVEKIHSVSSEIEVEQLDLSGNPWPEERVMEAEVYYAISSIPRPEQAPNLRWVQGHWAGVDQLRDNPIWNTDIKITTASGIHAPNMAQYTFAQILNWANRVQGWQHYQSQGEWPKNRWEKFVPDELRDRTIGILGYGSLGREIGRLAKSFGMRVLATKRDARRVQDEGYVVPGTGDPEGIIADRIYPSEATRSMVSICDYLVITLPLTENTKQFVNESLLREMQRHSFLVNIGRGGVVNESDLARALKKGWIAGAGLDVFENEPLPADSPLWSLENVIISPHVSGFTPFYDERVTDLFADNLRRYVAGDRLLNVVNREIGY